MWLFTTFGFFSIVQKTGTSNLTVRARVAADLDALREKYMPELSKIETPKKGTDYPYRATIDHEGFSRGLAKLGAELNYTSFKDELQKTMSDNRSNVYTEIWCHLHQLEVENNPEKSAAPVSSIGKRLAYGGVVLNCEGKVLLREPFSHHGGYVWTFPKETPVPKETPEETALRAVLQRTGIKARVIDQIPGIYSGERTTSTYYLMSEEGESGRLGQCSKAVVWATREEAEAHIKMSNSVTGRARDLEVLNHAYNLYSQRFSEGMKTGSEIDEIEAGIINCAALRFDGYAYMDKTNFDSQAALKTYLDTGDLPLSPLDKLCVFFSLQRFLMKWSSNKKGRTSQYWKAFRELFLLTSGYCIPNEYRYEECTRRWKSEFTPKLNESIALVQVIHQTTKYDE